MGPGPTSSAAMGPAPGCVFIIPIAGLLNSAGCDASVGDELRAGCEARVVAGDERDERCHLVCSSEPVRIYY